MKFEDSPFECQWIYDFLLRLEVILNGKLPSSRSYSPSFSIGNGCALEAYEGVSDQAYGISEAIKQAVSVYILTGKWGRIKVKESFWLKAFLFSAHEYIFLALSERVQLGCLRLKKSEAKPSGLEKSDQEVLEWLLSERWDEYLLPLWLKRNAMEYIELYSYDCSEDSESDRDSFARKLENIPDEYYLWTKSGKRQEKRNGILHPPRALVPCYISTGDGTHEMIYL